MRALVFTGIDAMEVLDVAEPEAGPGEELLRVETVGICGSELHGIHGGGWRQPPLVMGHEIAGTDGSGRRVAVNPLAPCRSCDACARGQSNLCRDRSLVGIHRPGGFAERVAVPADSLHPLPDNLDWDAAALIEPLANAVHAVRLAGPLDGARVAVIGAGALGLLSAAMAVTEGAAAVTVADFSRDRLDVAERLGATAVTDRLSGEYDVTVDAVGAGVTRSDAIERLRPGGTSIWLGLHQAQVTLDGNAVVRSEQRVLGSFAYTDAEFADAVALTATTDLSWGTAVAMDDSAAVFLELAAGRSDIVRAVIHPHD